MDVIIFLMLLLNPKGTIRFFLTIAIIFGILIGIVGICEDGIKFEELVIIFISIVVGALVTFFFCEFLPERQKKQKLEREQQIREIILKREQQQKQQSNKK